MLDGRYRIQSKVGKGSLGTVYRAQHTSLTQRVAVKVLLPSVMALAGDADRFLATVKLVSRVRHRNIVDVLEFGKLDDTVYVAMEFLSSRTLDHLLRTEGRLPWRRARGVALQIVAALKAAHKRGVLHRGLHLGNCFVSERPGETPPELAVKVSDFTLASNGYSKEASASAENTSRFVGKPAYAAPELQDGEPTVQSDIYAFGVILYRMMAGSFPFEGGTPFQILAAHVECPVPRPRDKVAEIPEEVEAIILHALAKDPKERFESALELESALKDVDPKAHGDSSEADDSPEGALEDIETGQHRQAKGSETPPPVRDEAMHAAFERQRDEPPAAPTAMFERRSLAPYFVPAAEHLGLLPDPVDVPGAGSVRHAPMEPPTRGGKARHAVPMPASSLEASDPREAPLEPTVHFVAASPPRQTDPESTVLFGKPASSDRSSLPATERLSDLAGDSPDADAAEPTVHLAKGGVPTAALPIETFAVAQPHVPQRVPSTFVAPTGRSPSPPLVDPPADGSLVAASDGRTVRAPPPGPARASTPPPAAASVTPAVISTTPTVLSTIHILVLGLVVAILGALIGLALACPARERTSLRPTTRAVDANESLLAAPRSAPPRT